MRVYTALMDGISISAAKTLIRLSAPADQVLVLLRAWVEQQASETSEQLEVKIQRVSTDGTGTSLTPTKHEIGDPAFSGTAVGNLTAEPTFTANTIGYRDSFNILNGLTYLPVPEERIWIPPSGRIAFTLLNAPSPAITMTAGLTFGAIG